MLRLNCVQTTYYMVYNKTLPAYEINHNLAPCLLTNFYDVKRHHNNSHLFFYILLAGTITPLNS